MKRRSADLYESFDRMEEEVRGARNDVAFEGSPAMHRRKIFTLEEQARVACDREEVMKA